LIPLRFSPLRIGESRATQESGDPAAGAPEPAPIVHGSQVVFTLGAKRWALEFWSKMTPLNPGSLQPRPNGSLLPSTGVSWRTVPTFTMTSQVEAMRPSSSRSFWYPISAS
jgi:hypothetical protein